MYGLVNKAVEQMVCTGPGVDMWQQIKKCAHVDVDMFLSMHQYPDEVTYRLVDAASQKLGHSHAEILRAFGRYWILYTAAEGYGDIVSMTGSTFLEFLQNLPNLHARVELTYPHLQPPVFECSDMTDHSVVLHYYSERQGLAPMVVGLLEGLSERYQTPITIELLKSRETGHDHEEFAITLVENKRCPHCV